jgi:homoserine kinase
VLTPEQSISTHQSRAALPPTVPHADAAFNVGRAALLVAALLTGRVDLLRPGMDDRLHQTYRAATYPAMPAIIGAALDAGAAGAALSGSGPSILALCAGPTAPVAAAMAAAAHTEGLSARVRELQIAAAGAAVVTVGHER